MATVATVSASEPAGAGAPVDTSLFELRDAPDGQAVLLFKGDAAYELVVGKLGCDALSWWTPMGETAASDLVCEIAPASLGAARALAAAALWACEAVGPAEGVPPWR